MTTPKRPTDTQIVKAFQKYEEGFNVAVAALHTIQNDMVREQVDYELYEGHRAFRVLAHEAQARIDVKKESKQ